jgi:energy-coupling factor transport system permease protein
MIYLLCILLIALALKLDFSKFLRVVRRMRWLFFSIFIIYAFGTPGEYIQYFPDNYAPTFEGCSLGLLQIVKLLIALASLSIIFATSSKEDLMLGLYMLLSPLKLLGLNVQIFTARLLLTLEYVEALAAKENLKFNFNGLKDLHVADLLAATASLNEQKVLVMQPKAFNFIDKFLLVLLAIGLLVTSILMVLI